MFDLDFTVLILSVKFIVQLWLCIMLNEHYNETDSESITCHRFCIALICWNQKGNATAVTNYSDNCRVFFVL